MSSSSSSKFCRSQTRNSIFWNGAAGFGFDFVDLFVDASLFSSFTSAAREENVRTKNLLEIPGMRSRSYLRGTVLRIKNYRML